MIASKIPEEWNTLVAYVKVRVDGSDPTPTIGPVPRCNLYSYRLPRIRRKTANRDRSGPPPSRPRLINAKELTFTLYIATGDRPLPTGHEEGRSETEDLYGLARTESG